MSVDLIRLRTIIRGDAARLVRAKMGDDTGIEKELNTPSVAVARRISKEKLLRWCAVTGALNKLQEAAKSANPTLASYATAGLAVLTANVDWMNLDDELKAMLNALVTAGVLLASDVSQLLARATELISLAEFEFGESVSLSQVSESLLPDRPDGKVEGV
jgi:hypothetical protein